MASFIFIFILSPSGLSRGSCPRVRTAASSPSRGGGGGGSRPRWRRRRRARRRGWTVRGGSSTRSAGSGSWWRRMTTWRRRWTPSYPAASTSRSSPRVSASSTRRRGRVSCAVADRSRRTGSAFSSVHSPSTHPAEIQHSSKKLVSCGSMVDVFHGVRVGSRSTTTFGRICMSWLR